MTWEWRRHDRALVLECLQQGEYDAIATSSQGALDELAHLTAELGVWEALEVIQVHREREGIPDGLLLRTLTLLPFVEALGLSAAAETLFQDAAILLQLGYAIFQIQNGFNERHHPPFATQSEKAYPYHPEVLRQEAARIDLESLHTFRQRCIRPLFERRLVRGKTYAIDGSGIGNRWRVVGLLNVNPERALWVTWRVTFTCIAFNTAQLAKTAQGQRWVHLGIRRLRRELTRQIGPAPVIVFARDCYGIFDIEEIVTALGHPRLFPCDASLGRSPLRIALRHQPEILRQMVPQCLS